MSEGKKLFLTSPKQIYNGYLYLIQEPEHGSLRIRVHLLVGEQENISMFSTCSELTPRSPIPDGRMERIMQPWWWLWLWFYQDGFPYSAISTEAEIGSTYCADPSNSNSWSLAWAECNQTDKSQTAICTLSRHHKNRPIFEIITFETDVCVTNRKQFW